MKPVRVTISSCVVAAVLLFIFLVPLPVSRVIQTGAVELQPGFAEAKAALERAKKAAARR